MADDRKLSASSTLKQTEPEEQYVYDVENFVQKELQKAGIKPNQLIKTSLYFLLCN